MSNPAATYNPHVSESVRAVIMATPRAPLETRRMPAPRAAAGGAVLQIVASEVCGTDVHLHHGHLPGVPYPIVPGHVSIGRVLETGGQPPDFPTRLDWPSARYLEVCQLWVEA